MTTAFALILLFAIVGNAQAITRSSLASYASSLKGLKKADLKTAIYEICQPTKILSYGSGSGATWSGFVKTDRVGNTLECRNRYSDDKFYFTSTTQTSAISGMNIEHSLPKSWWGGGKNNAYKDLFELYPSESSANSSKSNYGMGEVTNVKKTEGIEKIGTGPQGSFTVVEPADTWKGDFSRGYFYMVTTYQNLTFTSTEGANSMEANKWPTLKEWAYTLYLKWGHNDPVDDIEIDRNNAVYEIQGNRNLFIDYPYLADYVWGDSTDVAFDPTTSISTAIDDDRYTGETPTPTPDPTTVAAPTFSPGGGTYTTAQSVTISSTTGGATIYYTLDGSTPTTSSNVYSATISVSSTTMIKAIAVKDGTSSSVSSATYTISSTTPSTDDGTTYVKVTSNDQLVAGKKYLIVYEKGSVALSAKGSGNYRSGTSVTIADNTITTETNVSGKPYQLTLGGASGAWTFYDATSNAYLGLTSDANNLNDVATATTGTAWTIDVTTNNSIKNNSYTSRYLKYNTSSPRFACYKTTVTQAQPVALYVQQTSTPAESSPVRYKSSADDTWHYLLPDANGAYNITDGDYYTFDVSQNVENATVNYTRNFTAGTWAAWSFPVDIAVDADLLNDYQFGYLEGVSNKGNDIDKNNLTNVTIGVKMLKAGKTVKANLPYVVLPQTSGSKTFTFNNVTLKKTEAQSTSITGNSYVYTSIGVYTRKDYANDTWYALTTNGQLRRAGTGAFLNPFRFYLSISDNAGNPYDAKSAYINLNIVDDTTGINKVDATRANNDKVYDLQGRRVYKPVQGVYIVNGRKMVLGK